MTKPKKLALSLLLAIAGTFAFTLSFNAQMALAVAGGIEPGLAFMYPGIVDVAIVAGLLIRIWAHPDLAKKLSRYLWGAIAFWTATSILGNAISILALPDGRITIPTALAIAVHAMPAITLFLVMHITAAIAFRPPTTAAPAPRARAPRPTTEMTSTRPTQALSDIPPVTDEQLLTMSEQGLSMSEIATQVGRSKSYVGAHIQYARDARTRKELTA